MNDWNNFFSAAASASATLTGLLFVAVSINLAKILSLPSLPNRAGQSIILLLAILLISLLFLVPRDSLLPLGITLLCISIFVDVLMVIFDYNHLKFADPSARKRVIIYAVLSQLSVLPYICCAITLLCGNENGIGWMHGCCWWR